MKTNTKQSFRTGSLLALALAALLSAPLSADTLTYMSTFSGLSDSGTIPVNLSQFNPSLGTLTEVTLELSNVYVVGTASVQNTTGDYQDYSISLAGQYKISDTSGNRITIALTTPTYTTIGNPSYPLGLPNGATFTTPSETNSTPGGGLVNITDGSISAYIGTGTTATLVSLKSSNGVTVSGPSPYNTNSSSLGSGTYEIIYTYTAVPEPAQTAAWMIAFAGLVLVGRKYFRRTVAPASLSA